MKGKFEQQRQNKKRRFISEQQGLIFTDGQLTFMTLFHPSYGTCNVIYYFFDIQALVDSIPQKCDQSRYNTFTTRTIYKVESFLTGALVTSSNILTDLIASMKRIGRIALIDI